MFFLIRVAFWLSIVVLLLPTGKTPHATPGPQVGAVEAMTAAGAAVSDLGGFCARQPEACTIGSQAAAAFGQKAQASAKMIYEFLTERFSQDESKPAARPVGSQDTLAPADLAPAWRGPHAPRPERYARSAS